MMIEKTSKCEKFKLVAPDGDWGFLICITALTVYTITGGFSTCFGMMYNDFMVEIGMETSTMALVTGLNAMSIAISGFLTSLLLKVVTVRQLAFIAAALYNFGMFSLIFARTAISFLICQSFIQSFGFGLLYNLVCTIVNDYFIKRRLFAVGIIQTATAVFTLFLPLLVKTALERYDYRGMLLIVSAINLHLFPAVALMQPVKWHMKKEKILDENNAEMRVLLVDKNKTDIPTVKITEIEEITTTIESKDIDKDESSIMKENDSVLKKTIKELFNVTLMKSFLPSYACLGVSVAIFGDFIYGVMIPQALYANGWSQNDVAWAVSLIGFGDLAARITFIFFSKWLLMIGSTQLHLISPVAGIVARIGMLSFKDMSTTLIFMVLIGVSRCFLFTLIPIVIADEVGAEKFTSAMGMFMFLTGVINLGFGPAVGAVRDLTGNYDDVSWISCGFLLAAIILWCFEKCCKRYRRKDIYEKCSLK